MSRDDAYLYDILESARAVLTYMREKDWESFSSDSLLQDAVVRRLEIIGEASAEYQQRRNRNITIYRGRR